MYWDIEILGDRDIETLRYWDMRIKRLGYWNIEILRYYDIDILRY